MGQRRTTAASWGRRVRRDRRLTATARVILAEIGDRAHRADCRAGHATIASAVGLSESAVGRAVAAGKALGLLVVRSRRRATAVIGVAWPPARGDHA
jgi:hypothetical protein